MIRLPSFLAVLLCFNYCIVLEGAELIRHFNFDDDFTESVLGNPPTKVIGQPKLVSGISGKALQLDGQSALQYDDYFDLNLETFTLTAWVKPHEDDPTGNIAGKGSDIYWIFLNHGEVKAGFYDDSFREALSSTYLQKDRWYFIAVTYDGEMLRLYIDHHLHWIIKVRSAPRQKKGEFIIGAEGNSPPKYFLDATIDEVRLYDGALSKKGIMELYKGGRPE